MKFHFFSADAVEVSERLNHGTLDFAVMLEPVDDVRYDYLPLPDCSEWGILCKKTDKLAKKGYVTKKDIKTIPLIMHQRAGLQKEIICFLPLKPQLQTKLVLVWKKNAITGRAYMEMVKRVINAIKM